MLFFFWLILVENRNFLANFFARMPKMSLDSKMTSNSSSKSKFGAKKVFWGQFMAKSKKLAEKALEKSFLLSGLTFEGPVGPPNPFETSPMLILHSFGYLGMDFQKKLKLGVSSNFQFGVFSPPGQTGPGGGGYLGKSGCWVCADLKGRFFHLPKSL